ncbi:hypothetical protein [Nitrosovibrio sp. Nv6]|uniref:hypothetical protein n=1 Tax=Nitrosovibrio sp. Nv6 TaxID=1855340 RepID=UPI0008C36DE4|nr:hypothetical protein [Nitrosovibrio sp. Nv6]SEO64104.1 hypothetical protein SAMN05216316_0686 [Nitrosovibrio sp. Nv6]
MSALSDRMNAIKSTLATMYPARTVTRDLKDFAARPLSELQEGIYTVLSASEGNYSHYLGGMTRDGEHRVLLVGQIAVTETAEPSATEDAEGTMIDEIKAFTRALPPELGSLTLTGWRQSQQLEHPYGWVAFDMTLREG